MVLVVRMVLMVLMTADTLLLAEGKRPSPAGGRRVYERLLAPAGPLGGQGRCAGLVQNTKQEVEALPIRSVAHPDMPGPIASLDVRREGQFMEHERSACIVWLTQSRIATACLSNRANQSCMVFQPRPIEAIRTADCLQEFGHQQAQAHK